VLVKQIHKRSQNEMFDPFTRFYFLRDWNSCEWIKFDAVGVRNTGEMMNKMIELNGSTNEQTEAVLMKLRGTSTMSWKRM